MSYVLIKYAHLLGILALTACLALEYLLLRGGLDRGALQRLSLIDRVYGLSAVLVLAAGLLLWFQAGKGADFYASNPVFHAKVSLFVLVGLASIHPTLFISRARRSGAALTRVPASVRLVLRLECGFLALMPLLAVLMAQGHGLS